MKELTARLQETFADRLIFVGLQGSYARDEATLTSDLDVVVIIDQLSLSDLKEFKKTYENLIPSAVMCGFVGGADQLRSWPAYDLLQFEKETIPYYGNLTQLLPPLTTNAVKESIKIGAANLYHGIVHFYLHENKNQWQETLKEYYKSASFIIQALHYLNSGDYVTKKADLLPLLTSTHQTVLLSYLDWSHPQALELDRLCDLLLNWSGQILQAKY